MTDNTVNSSQTCSICVN